MALTSRRAGSSSPANGISETSDLDLTAFLRILRRRLWVLILVPILVAVSAYGFAKTKTPLYRSKAEILLVETQAEKLFDPAAAASSDPIRVLDDQIQVIQSNQLASMVKATLGYVPTIEANASTTEDVITLTAVSSNPKQAASNVNAYANAYLKYRQTSGASQNSAAQTELQHEIDAAQTQLNALDQAVAAQPTADAKSQLLTAQADQRAPLESQVSSEATQLSELQAAAAVDEGGAQLSNEATAPPLPFSPEPTRDAALGLAVGLMLALGLAFLLDYLDNRVRGREDLDRASGDVPVVGMIPAQAEWKDADAALVISVEKPESGSAEAYRTLRTSIQFFSLDRSLHTVQVTSPMTSEGKTTTVVNLAVALARAGQRVIVIDCDLRRPRVHTFLGLDPDPGFTSVLLGEMPLEKALRPIPEVEELRVLTAGPIPPNPSELLSGRRVIELFEALKADSDFVLIDSPPVLPVSDATVIATRVDATLVVVRDNTTLRKHLSRSLELLHQLDAIVIGTVLNGVAEAEVGYGYQYGYRAHAAKSEDKNGACQPRTAS